MRNSIICTVNLIKSTILRWTGHVPTIEEGSIAFKFLSGKHTGNRPLGRPRCRWEGNLRIYLEGIGVSAMNWVNSALDKDYLGAPANAVLNLRVLEAIVLVR